jgi:xanthine/CO dehydrogenase XdhC/CoxF family maturation factor
MRTVRRENATFLVVDFQGRLMSAIEDGRVVVRNARRLLDAATLPRVYRYRLTPDGMDQQGRSSSVPH